MALWGAVLAFFLRFIMTGLEVKVEKLLYTAQCHCLLGADRDGGREDCDVSTVECCSISPVGGGEGVSVFPSTREVGQVLGS